MGTDINQMALHDALPILFERFNAAVSLWNLLATVVFASLGFIVTARNVMRLPVIKILLSIAYLVFASINLSILEQVEAQRRVMSDFVIKILPGSGVAPFQNIIAPPSDWETAAIHLLADVVVIAAIWIIPGMIRIPPR